MASAVQTRAGSPFCCILDAAGPPCLTANVRLFYVSPFRAKTEKLDFVFLALSDLSPYRPVADPRAFWSRISDRHTNWASCSAQMRTTIPARFFRPLSKI